MRNQPDPQQLRVYVRALEHRLDLPQELSNTVDSGSQRRSLVRKQQGFEKVAVRVQPVHEFFTVTFLLKKLFMGCQRKTNRCIKHLLRMWIADVAPRQCRLQLITS